MAAQANQTFFVKIIQLQLPVDNDKKPHIYIYSKWLEDRVDLLLFESTLSKSFKGKITYENMRESADDLELDYDEFFKECKNALTTPAPTLLCYEYEIERTDIDYKFKLIKKDLFDIILLETDIKQVYHDEILDVALEMFAVGHTEVDKTQDLKYNENLKRATNMLNKLQEEKIISERKLYQKFEILLNKKKQRIKELEDQLYPKNGTKKTNDCDDVPSTSSRTTNGIKSDDATVAKRAHLTCNQDTEMADDSDDSDTTIVGLNN